MDLQETLQSFCTISGIKTSHFPYIESKQIKKKKGFQEGGDGGKNETEVSTSQTKSND